MEHRIVKNDEGVSPVIAVILMVAITVVLAAVLYVWAASFLEQGESAPMATFTSKENSGGSWQINVVKVSKQEDLAGFSFFLKDPTGSTYVGGNGFGEIAMQIVAGEEHGIDVSYDGDSVELQSRAGNISSDDGTQYPVHFYDDDGDGQLTPGDYFLIYGNGDSANGPARENWTLDIQFDSTGDLVGRVILPSFD